MQVKGDPQMLYKQFEQVQSLLQHCGFANSTLPGRIPASEMHAGKTLCCDGARQDDSMLPCRLAAELESWENHSKAAAHRRMSG